MFGWTSSLFAPDVSPVMVGASLTAVTSTVMMFGVGSRLTPPFAVPPLSSTWNVKLA
jgi:hypothetical protein